MMLQKTQPTRNDCAHQATKEFPDRPWCVPSSCTCPATGT